MRLDAFNRAFEGVLTMLDGALFCLHDWRFEVLGWSVTHCICRNITIAAPYDQFSHD
jgi:hypothetical protein